MDIVALKKNEESVTSHRKLSWILPEERLSVALCSVDTLKKLNRGALLETCTLDYFSVFLQSVGEGLR